MLQFKDFLSARNMFSDKEESELTQAKKKIIKKLMKAMLEGRVNPLSNRESQVYKLREQGLDYEEIAKKLGIKETTCRKRLSSANKKIRIMIELFEEEQNANR